MKRQFHKYFCDKRLLSISFPLQDFGEIFEITATGKLNMPKMHGNEYRKYIFFMLKIVLEKISLKN